MSYPKWITRSSPLTNIEAFCVHNGMLYFVSGVNIYRLDSWCEDSGDVMTAESTRMHAIAASNSTYSFDNRNTPTWAMCSAQDLIWITASKELYSYDPDTDTLSGPWSPPTSESSQVFYDVAEYGGEIHVLERFSSSGSRVRLLKYSSGSLVSVYQYPAPANSAFGSLVVFQDELYFPATQRLMAWNGSAASTKYTFPYVSGDYELVAAMYSPDDLTLYVGTGSWLITMSSIPRLYSWDGSSMTFIVNIHDSLRRFPRVFAYRSGDLYVLLFLTGLSRTSKIVSLVDISGASSSVDLMEGANIRDRGLIVDPSDATVWAGAASTKVFSPNPCKVRKGRVRLLWA
jgi:hypothetical protein